MATDVPTKTPPGTTTSSTTGTTDVLGTSAPRALSATEEATLKDGSLGTAPTLPPPISQTVTAAIGEATTGGITATNWHTNKHVNALWGINQNRNSWMGTDDAGWKKLANNSDTAIMALTILAGHARDANSLVSYREETSDGMVHEIYVW